MVRPEQIKHPPKLATALLTLSTSRVERGFLLGDLAEEFRELARDFGGRAASRWYWSQALRSAGPLFGSRLTSERMARSAGAITVGVVTAITSATLFGTLLGQVLGMNAEATFGVIAVVVTACALVSSICAGWASTWVSGGPYRWALALIGLVIVAPDLVYAFSHHGAEDLPRVLLPPSMAILATCAGLALGGKLCRLIHVHA